MTLVEGKHGTGKSVFCQHLVHSALVSGKSVAFYSSETGSPSLISQMSSLEVWPESHWPSFALRQSDGLQFGRA